MHPILFWLRGMRASNLVFLFAAPVIIWLLATSRNYGPALVAVLGVEDNATDLLAAFAIVATAAIVGVVGAIKLIRALRPDQSPALVARQRRQALWAFGVQTVLLAGLSRLPVLDPYATSVALNITDPRNVTWILVVDQNFRLDPAFEAWFLPAAHRAVWFAALVAAASAGFAALPQRLHRGLAGGAVLWALLALNLCLAFFFLMVAHAGFATGLMVTLRAAVFAYLGASVLGLVWAFCGRLKPSARASRIMTGIGIVALGVAVWHGMKPEAEVVLGGPDLRAAAWQVRPEGAGGTQDEGGALLFVWSLEVLANLNTKNIHFAQLSTDKQASTVTQTQWANDCFLNRLTARIGLMTVFG